MTVSPDAWHVRNDCQPRKVLTVDMDLCAASAGSCVQTVKSAVAITTSRALILCSNVWDAGAYGGSQQTTCRTCKISLTGSAPAAALHLHWPCSTPLNPYPASALACSWAAQTGRSGLAAPSVHGLWRGSKGGPARAELHLLEAECQQWPR